MSPFALLDDPARALSEIRAAGTRIAAYVRRTPCVYSYTFSESSGSEVHLKLENLQRTGSFKARGALNKVLGLSAAGIPRPQGLIAASAGNHAQGVALAARTVGLPATIVMPERTAWIKVQRTESYGARVVIHGESYDSAQAHAAELAQREQLLLIHPFDDEAIVLGQATVGLEILEDLPEVDAILVPVGGGGLLAGIALAVRALAPHVRVIGVQARGAASMVESLRAGARTAVKPAHTLADGIRVGLVGELTYEIARRCVDECVVVEEADLLEAQLQTMEKSKLVAEPAGAAGIAALIAGKVFGAKRVCSVVSGGNVDLNLVARMIESGLAASGRTHRIALRLPDRPGQLARVLEVVSASSSNILDVQHERSGWKVPVGFVDVEILIETRRPGSGAELDALLRERGFELR